MNAPRLGGPPRPDERRRWLVLITVVFGAFVSILDSTIVNTALPTIQHDLHADLHTATYVATGYILAASIMVPLSAYLANRFGIKRVYLTSLAVFTVCSALCGLAPNIMLLIAFRVLQGAGGAALFPLSFAILFAVFPDEERGRANGIFGIPVLVAPTIGPTIGGFLVEYVGWRWVFYVNVPIGIIGLILGWRVLCEHVSEPNRRLDPLGFVIVAAGLFLLLYGLSNLAYYPLGDLLAVSGPIVLGIVLVILFGLIEPYRVEPLLDLRLYRYRNFLVGNLITWVATVGLFGPAFLLPQFLQTLLGLSPFVAGLLLISQGIGAIVGSFASGSLYNRIGPRRLILAGAACMLVTGLILAGWTSATAAILILPWILLPRGFGLPFLTQPTNTASLDGIYGAELPEATTLNVVARNVVASFSVAILTSILQQRTTVYLARLGVSATRVATQTQLGQAARESLAVRQAQALAYHDVFLITALSVVPAFGLAFFLRWRHRGSATQ
jgi:DHA2 family multidrug resistance protein